MLLVSVDYSSIINSFSSLFVTYSQYFINILIGLLVFLIGYIIIKLIAKTINKVLTKLRLDELGAKLQEIDLFSGMEINIPSLLSKVFYYFMLFILILVTVSIMGIEFLSDGLKSIMAYMPILLSAGFMFLAGAIIASFIRKFLRTATASLNISSGKFISDAVFYFLITIIAITSLNQAGLNTSLLTNHFTMLIGAILLAFVIGFGFASKDIMSSMLSSFYTKDKITVGQKIKIGEVNGEITEIDATSVTIKTSGKKHVNIPMKKLATEIFEVEK